MTGTNSQSTEPRLAALRELAAAVDRLRLLFTRHQSAHRKTATRRLGPTTDAKPEDPEELGRRIMAKHNPHYRKGAGRG